MARTKIGRKRRYSVSLSDGVVKKLLELGVQLAGTTSLSEAVEHSVAFAHVEMFGKQSDPKRAVPSVRKVDSALGMVAVEDTQPESEPTPDTLPTWDVPKPEPVVSAKETPTSASSGLPEIADVGESENKFEGWDN